MVIATDQQEKLKLKKFREWILSQPRFVSPRTDDIFLLRFLNFRKFNLEETFKVFEKYMKVRQANPHCYKNLDVHDPQVCDLMKRGYLFPLLERDSQGRTVIFGRCAAFNQKYGHRPTDLFRAIMMTLEVLLEDEYNQRNGFVYIFDEEGVGLSEVTYLGIREIKRLLQSGEKALPVKHKEVHWLHLPHLIRTILVFISSFLTEKLQDRLYLPKNLGELKISPTRILPKEYGGTVSWRVMSEKWIKKLEDNRDRLLALDNMVIDENRKKSKKIHIKK